MLKSNDRLLVTGGNGFIGKALLPQLYERYPFVDIYAPRGGDYDLRDSNEAYRLFYQFRPTYVLHLASLAGGLPFNKENPYRLISDNIKINGNVLDACVKHREEVKKIVCTGSICGYPHTPPQIPFKEENLFDGAPEPTNRGYGVAKNLMLLTIQAARQQFGLNGVFLLIVNNYGENDHFFDIEKGHVIPNLIRKFDMAKDANESFVTLYGDGSATREFLYSGETARAVILALENYNESEPVNVGSGEEISIKDLALKIKALTGYRGDIKWDSTYGNGQPRRVLDVSRAKEKFGFVNQVSLNEGLRLTVENYYELKRQREAA